ncbi:MAG: HD domain-containing protein [Caldisericia bacterium]|nr:HD domain-containing protein [Caldisericia bacterium]
MDIFSKYLDNKYKAVNLISDPIYGTIRFTSPISTSSDGKCERDLIDNKWLQRLRKIHQLQSAFLVFPSAENSRFIHSLGTMHLAGEFGRHLYKDLKENFEEECPSQNFIEEFLRICGLLHDVGHGPFGHMFDESFLKGKFNGLNHEKIGCEIIKKELGEIIVKIKRGPNGFFNEGEIIEPEHICYVINRSNKWKKSYPKWLKSLRCLFCGKFFTVDNLDYVLRDSYFTGYSKDPINLDRILFYTSIDKDGLVFASPGRNTFRQFINLKIDLYNSVYFHRTVRAIDLSIDSIFYKTMERFCNFNPLDNLDKYLEITEWDLFNIIKEWLKSVEEDERELGIKWQDILQRKKLWFVAFENEIKINIDNKNNAVLLWYSEFKEIENKINERLKKKIGTEEFNKIAVTIDTEKQDPRPLSMEFEGTMKIFDNKTCAIEKKKIFDWISDIPVSIIILRVYTNSKKYINEIAEISNDIMSKPNSYISTNI